MEKYILENIDTIIIIFAILTIWDLIWKLFAMWKAANNRQFIWFICLAVFSTIGILPIIYLILKKDE